MKYLLTIALAALTTTAAFGQSSPLPPGTSDTDQATEQARPSAPAPTSPLNTAESDIEAKNYPAARGLLDAYLSTHPADARGLFDRGYVDDAQNRPDAAAAYYRKAIAADPKLFEPRLALGLILAGQGKSSEAIDQLKAAVPLAPNPPNPAAKAQGLRALAELLRTSDPDAARQALLAALSMSPETVGDTLLTGEIAEAEGDPTTAEAAYRRVLAVQPNSSTATAGLAHLLIASKRYSEAEPLIKSALARDPDDPALNTELASILNAEGKQQESVAVLEKLHLQEPNSRTVSGMLADAYDQTGDPAKADPLYRQLLTATPNDPALLAEFGANLIKQQQYGAAIPVLQHAVQIAPGNGNAWSSLAFAASESHQPELTLQALSMRSKTQPETPATYFLRATAYDALHQTKLAAENYHKFIDAAGTGFPDQVWQAKHRLVALGK